MISNYEGEEKRRERSTQINLNNSGTDNPNTQEITLYRNKIIMIYYVALGKESGINFIILKICATSFTILLFGCFAWNNFYSYFSKTAVHITSHMILNDDYK